MAVCRSVVFVPSWLRGSTRLRQAFWWRGGAGGVRPCGRVVPWSATARGPAQWSGLTARFTGLPAAAGELYVRPRMPRRLSARQRRNCQPLTPALVHRIAASVLPKRNDYGVNTYDEIVDELSRFGIANRGAFIKFMKRHRQELLRIDRDHLLPWEVKFFSQEFGAAFVKDAIRRQYWFALPAMIRNALELEFGEAAAVYEAEA